MFHANGRKNGKSVTFRWHDHSRRSVCLICLGVKLMAVRVSLNFLHISLKDVHVLRRLRRISCDANSGNSAPLGFQFGINNGNT